METRNIQKLIKQLADAQPATDNVFWGVVKKVSEQRLVCEVEPFEGATVLDVRLVADIQNPGMICIPKIDSVVGVVMENENAGFIALHSQIAQIKVNLLKGFEGSLKKDLKLDVEGEIKLNDGSNGGLVKITELKNELAKVNQAIQKILNLFSNWTPSSNDGGAALKTLATSTLTGVQFPDYKNIENPKIKH